ncbi:hypothetical protein MMPV_002997 [Pyropia vietnamensis]
MDGSADPPPSNGFVPLSIPLPPVPGVPDASHVLYLRRHTSSLQPTAGGSGRGKASAPPSSPSAEAAALFIANLPPNFTTLDAARLVRLPDPPAHSQHPAGALTADTPDGGHLVVGPLADGRGLFARVTLPPLFGPTAITDILRSPAQALDTAVVIDALTAHWRSAGGPGVWLAAHTADRSEAATADAATAAMEAAKAAKAAAKAAAHRAAAAAPRMDADGFTLVTSGPTAAAANARVGVVPSTTTATAADAAGAAGGAARAAPPLSSAAAAVAAAATPGTDPAEAAAAAAAAATAAGLSVKQRRLAAKRAKKVARDRQMPVAFYRYEAREAKSSRIAKLRRAFGADRERVDAVLREQRKKSGKD